MNAQTPLSCDLGVFTPAQREAHLVNTTRLIQAVEGVQEIENGYRFVFANETALISQIAEFIAKERLCCPFLTFTLQVAPANEPLALTLSGPSGTREFLQAEFSGAIP